MYPSSHIPKLEGAVMRHFAAYILLMFVLICGMTALSSAQSTLVNGHLVVVGHTNYCEDAGSNDTYACNLLETITTYTTGTVYVFKANTANTGAASINFNSIGASTIKKMVGGVTTDLSDNDIRANQRVMLLYDGTNMQMVSQLGNCAVAGSETVVGCVELATTAETTTGSSTTLAVTPGGLAASTLLRSIYIPAGGMDVSGTCAANATAALLTNGPKLITISCTDNDADSIEFDWVMPDGYDGGTITVELAAFSVGNNNTEVFEMDCAGQAVSSGDTPTAHSTTGEQAATITWGNAANVEHHATTSAITIQGTPVAGDHIYMRCQVDATATTTSPIADVKIVGAKIEYTRTRGTD